MSNRGNVECVAFWLRLPLFWEDFRSWNRYIYIYQIWTGRYGKVSLPQGIPAFWRPQAQGLGCRAGDWELSLLCNSCSSTWQLEGTAAALRFLQLAQGFKPMQWNISYSRNLSAKCNQLRSMRPSKALTLQLRQTNSGLTNTVDFASTNLTFLELLFSPIRAGLRANTNISHLLPINYC